MFDIYSRDEHQRGLSVAEVRARRLNDDAERKLELREAALAVAGPEPTCDDRDDATAPHIPAGAGR